MIRNALKTTTCAALLVLTCLTGSAGATGVPTFDLGAIAELKKMISEAELQLNEAIQQNLKLDQQTLKMLEQIKLMENQVAAMRDSYDQAKMLISGEWLKDMIPEIPDLRGAVRTSLTGQWDQIGTDGEIGGKKVSSIVDTIFASVGTTTKAMSDLANSTDVRKARIGAQGNTGAMMGVAAEASAQQAEKSLDRLAQLTDRITDTKGLKEAIDLNTRMTAELGVQLGNIWQMEAAQTIGLGQAGVMSAATLADEQKYLDLTGDK